MEEPQKTEEELKDAEDLKFLRAARNENEGKSRLSHDEMMKELGME